MLRVKVSSYPPLRTICLHCFLLFLCYMPMLQPNPCYHVNANLSLQPRLCGTLHLSSDHLPAPRRQARALRNDYRGYQDAARCLCATTETRNKGHKGFSEVALNSNESIFCLYLALPDCSNIHPDHFAAKKCVRDTLKISIS